MLVGMRYNVVVLFYLIGFIKCATAPQPLDLIDFDTNETFLSVFLTIYHMTWSHAVHFNQVVNVLRGFEDNPLPLYHDDTSLQIVCDQVLLGFIHKDSAFLYTRSRRLLLRILENRPTRRVIRALVCQAVLEDNEEIPRFIGAITPYYLRGGSGIRRCFNSIHLNSGSCREQ